MFKKNKYVIERDFEKKSFIRWRGQFWFQLLIFLLQTAFAAMMALIIGTLSKVIWYCISSLFLNLVTQTFWGVNRFPVFDPSYLQFLIVQSLTGQDMQYNNSLIVTFIMLGVFIYFEAIGIRRWRNWIQLYSNRSLNQTRWANLREIDRVYKLVPDRNKFYPGKSGALIAHIHGTSLIFATLHPILWLVQIIKTPLRLTREEFPRWYKSLRPHLMTCFPGLFKDQETVEGGFAGFYWIDDAATHDNVDGATRAGKDQRLGYPRIDVLRRAQIKDTLVDTDAKNEDAKMSYIPLRKAGYEVQLINILDVDWTESWNPFQTALDYAIDGEWDKARDEAMVVVQIIGSNSNPDQRQDDIWNSSAQNTQLAIILILLWLAIEYDDPTIATPASVPQFINSMNAFNDPENKNLDGLTQYLNMLAEIDPRPPILNEALLKAGPYLGSSGDTKTSIMFTLLEQVSLFASETVARLTSQSTVKVADYGFPRLIKGRFDAQYAGFVAMVQLINTDTGVVIEQDKLKISRSGVIEYPFQHFFPANWTVRFDLDQEQNPHYVRDHYVELSGVKRERRKLNKEVLRDKYSKKPLFRIVREKKKTKLLEHTSFSYDLRYTENPIAIFIITPQNNDNYAKLASLFVGQVFSINTAIAANITRRKMDHRIIYKLNEFSMFPRIPGFDNFLTRGLTYGHIVDIYLQDRSQLSKHYTEHEANEIEHQMLTTYYVQSKDADENEALSKSLGEVEVQKENANFQAGHDRQNKGNIQSVTEKRPLMTAKEVAELLDGEIIITRRAKRLDKRFKKVRPLPIFATGILTLPNARDLIGKSFRLDYYTTDLNLKNKNKHLSYDDLFPDFKPYFYALKDRIRAQEGDTGVTRDTHDVNESMQTETSTKQAKRSSDSTNFENESDTVEPPTEKEIWLDNFLEDPSKPFFSEDDLDNQNQMTQIEQFMGSLLQNTPQNQRTREMDIALSLAEEGELFAQYPNWNTNSMMLNLFKKDTDEVWKIEEYKRDYQKKQILKELQIPMIERRDYE